MPQFPSCYPVGAKDLTLLLEQDRRGVRVTSLSGGEWVESVKNWLKPARINRGPPARPRDALRVEHLTAGTPLPRRLDRGLS